MAVFCYLIVDEPTGEAVLIDPAGDFDRIFDAVKRRDADVKWVINTHHHFDHTSGNEHIIKITGAGLLIHELDAPKLNSIINRVMKFGGKSPHPVKLLKDKEIIKIGKTEISVVHTPGHTPGGICLKAGKNLFTGDTLFTEGTGRTDLPGGSEQQIMHSIRKIILALPDDTIIWPGHHYGRYPKSTVGEQKKYYL